ncbi:coiled-coil domain-containing protein 174 [Wyeomyia smithii]|uniref:coiled-coil domain-containing protein 174 n=1 Tax=Wyeomyia smithii TaxID=174621 RepID=UPI0024681E9D|nr:coiled-coil domain-containing protein 174 [Wyeomyia smithii]XP_055550850.1 coiled-coil domain-containing protein 174 [Wyeomyia smithii]XP_055550851.1 coiled-coil domain-containing protein 174 [Wyeomyia smithii]
MNDPNKKIDIDKSSLLSLKAELLRKQEEVSRAKAFNSIDDFVPKRVPKVENPDNGPRKSQDVQSSSKTEKLAIELEDSATLERSKKALVAKARYYDKMVASGGSLNSDENCLVMFNRKKQTGKPSTEQKYMSSSSDDDSELNNSFEKQDKHKRDSENDWVEFVDFLGRSRRCRKEELEDCLNKDRELARATSPREGQRARIEEAHFSGDDNETIGPVPSMAITEDTIGERFRAMRDQWAKQDEENLEKDAVTYQDVLYDEARQHGVGYYGFSTDREERIRQQHELDSIREATMEAQKEKENLRNVRDKIIAERVKAAKARQRARLGLPPEDEEESTNDKAKDEELYDTAAEKKRLKAEAKAQKKKEKEERKRERERQKHVRPWDQGKERDDELEWKPAREWHVMSQEEWNEMKRKERIPEFAPPVEKSATLMESKNSQPVENSSTLHETFRNNPLLKSYCGDNNSRLKAGGYQQENEEDDEDEIIGPLPTKLAPSGNNEEEVDLPIIPGMENNIFPEESNRVLFFTSKKNVSKRKFDFIDKTTADKLQSTLSSVINNNARLPHNTKLGNLTSLEDSYQTKFSTAKRKEFKRKNYDLFAETDEVPSQTNKPIPIRNELSDDDELEDQLERKQIDADGGVQIAPPPTYEYYGPSSSKRKPTTRQPPISKTALEASIEAGLKFLRNQSDKAGGPSVPTKNKWTTNADY